MPKSADKRRPGRPKGYPKTGGRKPGSKNAVPNELRNYINHKGRPLELLAAIASGRKVTAADPKDPCKKTSVYPSLTDRISAARVLMNKLVPDLRASEISGPDNGPIQIESEPITDKERARRIAFALRKAYEAQANSAIVHD